MNIPHDKFCVLPWISLEASPIGTLRPCCLAEEEILDPQRNKYNLGACDLQQVQNSDYMQNLRQQFLDGQQPRTCRKCWNEERAGRTSKRMHTLDRLQHILDDTAWTPQAKSLQFLDLKLGNICNLKCRICGSWSSSQFATEEINHMPPTERKSSFAYKMLRQGSWPKDNDRFWEDLRSVASGIRYIEFTGGEPFMIQDHFRLLEHIVESGHADQVEIHYNTNGTHFPEQAVELWKNFRSVEVAFSIDDVAERFEYQRTNASWQQVNDNIAKFRALRTEMRSLKLQCCSTINIFNIYYVPELARWIDQQDFDFVYWNVLHEIWYFGVACLSDTVKQQISEHLRSSMTGSVHADEINRIVDFMNSGASTDGFMTKMKIQDLDRKRQQNLCVIQPELAELLQYEPPTS